MTTQAFPGPVTNSKAQGFLKSGECFPDVFFVFCFFYIQLTKTTLNQNEGVKRKCYHVEGL